ncbi:MAG: hypothetical protein WA633_08735 [Stellaceae bacterium]
MQQHICATGRRIIGHEKEIVAGWGNGNTPVRAGSISEFGSKYGTRSIACEDAEHFAISRGISVDHERAVARQQSRDVKSNHFSVACVDLGSIIDMVAVASITEANANAHLVITAIIAYQLATGGKCLAATGIRFPGARLGV